MNRDIPFGRPDTGNKQLNDWLDQLYTAVQDWAQLPFGTSATQFLQYDPTSSRRIKWSVPAGSGGGGCDCDAEIADLQAQIDSLQLLVIALALGTGTPWPTTTSYDNVGGSGNRSGLGIVATSSSSTMSNPSTESLLLNGSYYDPTCGTAGSGSVAGKYIRFEFPSAVVVDEVAIDMGAGSNGTWQIQGSNDGSTWSTVSSTFTFSSPSGTGAAGGTTHASRTNQQLVTLTSVFAWKYYQLQGVSGSFGGTYLNEIEFKIYGL